MPTPEQIEAVYTDGSPKSRNAFERGRAVTPGVAKGAYYYAPYPLTMARGEGCYVYDIDGRRFTDFANHHTAQMLGHGHPAVLEAVREQIASGIALGAPTGIETEIAEEMCRRVASLDRIRFCCSGTEATLHAIRLARGFTGRPKIAKFEGGYHGSHDAVEVSVAPPLDRAGPEEAPHAVPTAGGMTVHAPGDVVVLPYNDEASVEQLLARHRDELACVIFDPKAGILEQRPGFVRFVRDCARAHDILFIFDEIVGFRMGTGGLQEHYGVTPDLTTYGKIVGGGFPVGAFGGRADLMDLLDPTQGSAGFFQSGTFSAHPVAMAAGLAMLRQLTPGAFAHVNGLGERLCTGLREVFDRHGIPARVVGLGSLFSVYFTDEDMTTYRAAARADKEKAHALFLTLINEGYYLANGMTMNALSAPMEASHVDGLVEAVGRALAIEY